MSHTHGTRANRKQIFQHCRRATIRPSAAPSGIQVLKLRCGAWQSPAIERPHSDSFPTLTPAAEIAAAGYSNYAKNRSQASPPPILHPLFATTRLAMPQPACE